MFWRTTIICVVYGDLKINLEKEIELTCSIIFYNFQRRLTGQECIDELKSFFGDRAPTYGNVKRWFN